MNDIIKECLEPILNAEVSDDIVEYILAIKNEGDYEEFMSSIIDFGNPVHVELYERLKLEQFGSRKRDGPKKYRDPTESSCIQPPLSNSKKGGKKGKYVNLNDYENKPRANKTGRQPCTCQAQRHELVNNCLECGRIACEQEGSGPCFFCGSMVYTKHEAELMAAKMKPSDKNKGSKKSKDLKKAIEARNKLVTNDQAGVSRNKIFDDESDYFQADSKWFSNEERKHLKGRQMTIHERMHKSKRDMKVNLDFATRTASLESDMFGEHKEKMLKGVNKLLDRPGRFPKHLFEGEYGQEMSELSQLLEEKQEAVHFSSRAVSKKDEGVPEMGSVPANFKITNDAMLEQIDRGMCLSMHQPWASLLVAGIKLHEGRTWKTPHRGKLWIQAGSKQPEEHEIVAVEQTYRILYNDPTLKFPKKYPTGCLLGSVHMEDCLEQREYHKRYPDGESDSPFVFICSSPMILPVFYPMQGQFKIFQLSKEIHRMAKAAILSSKWI